MIKVSHVCLFVRDQDEALDFYTTKLGFELRADVPFDGHRWLTVGPREQPDVHIALLRPDMGPLDTATQAQILELLAKGAMGSIILDTDDCRGRYEELRARGVEFSEEPTDRFYGIDAGLRDPSGNAIRLVQRAPAEVAPS